MSAVAADFLESRQLSPLSSNAVLAFSSSEIFDRPCPSASQQHPFPEVRKSGYCLREISALSALKDTS
jgi:hypothetical protein